LRVAFFLSFFIYGAYFHISYPLIDTFFGLYGFYIFLKESRKTNFWSGFFVGIFWFYWIALSFRYYDLTYMIPFIILLAGLVYGVIFALISYVANPFIKSLLLLLVSYIHPFGFSWFKPELIFVNSYLGVEKWQFGIILFSLSLYILLSRKRDKKFALISLLLILLSLNLYPQKNKDKKLGIDIKLYDQKLPQQIKWNPRYKEQIINNNLKAINSSIKNKKEMIILPESAFPVYLNKEKLLLKKLRKLSHKIIIVTGALKYTKKGFYNSTYYFINGKIKIADKVVLVPFGEEIPLPKPLKNFVNRIFFDGAEDFKTAKKPTVIAIKGKMFTNAICYEATEDIIYKNHPRYIIAISNNAWFTPSIEPTLQNLLLRYYAKIYHTLIIHSANMGISEIIFPL